MGGDSDHRETLARAYETLRRVDAAARERRLEEQLRGPVDDLACVEPVANWRGCSSTQAMTTSQFDQWCRDGKPALKPAIKAPVVTVTKSKVDDMIRTAIAGERTSSHANLETFAAIIGEECGRNEKALRTEIDALRAEVSTLRRELDSGVLELPGPSPRDWRHAATH